MKKIIFIVVTLSAALIAIHYSSPVMAQTRYQQLLKAYHDTFDEYQAAKDIYLQDRAEYLRYQTLVARSIAIKSTQRFLSARQKVLVAYLQMMKERIEHSPELTEAELKDSILYINQEIDKLIIEEPLFDAADDLDNLVRLSSQTEKRYGTFFVQGQRMKGLIIAGKVRALRKTAEELADLAGEQVARIKKEGLVDTVQMERWLLEAPERLTLAQFNEKSAIDAFLKNRISGANFNKQLAALVKSLRLTNQYLKETNNFLFQIIKDIRFD